MLEDGAYCRTSDRLAGNTCRVYVRDGAIRKEINLGISEFVTELDPRHTIDSLKAFACQFLGELADREKYMATKALHNFPEWMAA